MAAKVCEWIFCCPCKVCNVICVGTGDICLELGDACKSPFCLFVTVATSLNIPPIIYSLLSIVFPPDSSNENCRGTLWLSINIPLCIINILAAWYLRYKVKSSNASDDPELQSRHTASGRALYLVCHDVWIAIYILIAIGYFFWQCIGTWWLFLDDCPSAIHDPYLFSVIFGWIYILTGSLAFFGSLCCTVCDQRDYRKDTLPSSVPHEETAISPPNQAVSPTPQYSAVTGVSQVTKKVEQPLIATSLQQAQPPDPNDINEIPIAIAIPLQPPVTPVPPPV